MQPNSPRATEQTPAAEHTQATEGSGTRDRRAPAGADPEPAWDVDEADARAAEDDEATAAGTFVGLEDGEDEDLLNRLDEEVADSLHPVELPDALELAGFDSAGRDDEPLVLGLRPSGGSTVNRSPSAGGLSAYLPAGTAPANSEPTGTEPTGTEPGTASGATAGTAPVATGATPVDHPVPQRQRRPGEVGENRMSVWDEATVLAYRERLLRVRARFIDDPREAVDEARALAVEAVTGLTAAMLATTEELDPRHGVISPDTETMRMSVRRYTDFLDRILAL